MKRRHKLINILVLGIYLFYAVLPLLYSTGNAGPGRAGQAYASLSTVRQPIPEQDLLLVSSEEQGAHSSGSPLILLKKKRAISLSFNELAVKVCAHYAGSSQFNFSLKTALAPLPIPGDAPLCPHGFSYYCSGLSPPAA